MLAIPPSGFCSPIHPLMPPSDANSSLCRDARRRDAEGHIVSFRAPKRPKNKNYYDRSRYMHENKDNMDKSPDKIQTFAPHSTALERHFMLIEQAFTGSGKPFRAMLDLRAPHGRAARRSRFARAIRPCRPGVGGKAEPSGRLAATKGHRAERRWALRPSMTASRPRRASEPGRLTPKPTVRGTLTVATTSSLLSPAKALRRHTAKV